MFGARAIQRRREKEEELKAQKANGPPPAFVRTAPSAVKGGKGKPGSKKGKKVNARKESYDLIVNIDIQEWNLTTEQIADWKEVFMLFDRDEDGVLSFQELQVVMKSMGQRPTEEDLLEKVRSVSEDYLYDTVEFNEFLILMSKQQATAFTREDLLSSFKIFDEDENGHIYAADMVEVLTNLGDRLTKSEARKLVQNADVTGDGRIDYKALCDKLIPENYVKNQNPNTAVDQKAII